MFLYRYRHTKCFLGWNSFFCRYFVHYLLILIGAFLPCILYAQTEVVALSTPTSGISGAVQNITTIFLGSGRDILYAACYIIGVLLLITANNRHRIHHVSPRGMGIANSVFIALSGILLILIPILTRYIPGIPN